MNPWQRAGEGAQPRDSRRPPSKVAEYGDISKIVGYAAGCLERLKASVASEGRDALLIR
jgi:hypothetical protein